MADRFAWIFIFNFFSFFLLVEMASSGSSSDLQSSLLLKKQLAGFCVFHILLKMLFDCRAEKKTGRRILRWANGR